MLIAQITDCHIVSSGAVMADRVDPTPGLQHAIEYLNELGGVDLVIGTGDLVNDGTAPQYDQLELLLGELDAPFLAVPGNHDDRSEMRKRFTDLPAGGPDDPIDHVIDFDALRLVCLDTTVPGDHAGHLAPEQLAWLDAALGEASGRPVLVVQHHPPFMSSIDAMDHYRLATMDIEVDVLGRHHNVVAVIAGHYHRTIHTAIGGTVGFACPSTAVQLQARFGAGPTTYSNDPSALALHTVTGAAMTTHVVQLSGGEGWVPSWETTG